MKKIFLLLIIPFSLFSEENLEICKQFLHNEFDPIQFIKKIEDGDLSLSNHYISDLHLASLNKEQLKILRNFYFAKYGYIFKSSDLANYFTKFNWYSPKIADQDKIIKKFNKKESDSVNRINFFEKKSNEKPLTDIGYLIGKWHFGETVGSGYSERFIFRKDKKFTFFPSEGIDLPKFAYLSGKFEISNGILKLSVNRIKEYIHSESYVLADGGNHTCFWEKEELGNERQLEYPLVLNFPVYLSDYTDDSVKVLQIGSKLFYEKEFNE
ncbi:YARHG domain-containing protein [Leptospira congkakensis]|uniref:YARHG domain-containing protein n=1 Tax=Leptospira congkakensis TaxID=2484932 RepID=A0A8B5N7B6_9LEPT|nr:YARHG domain-containing protein [Leptospira congkakensis]TGL85793.1 YARHG domain-containing protein [Leptospira congkakensis]TGL87016.1 YARHG domain-containing protein [Leptospira congkakensis]